MNDLVKHIAIGSGVGVGGNIVAERYVPFITPNWFYVGGALLTVLGIVAGKAHYEYVPVGLSIAASTWIYLHYIAGRIRLP